MNLINSKLTTNDRLRNWRNYLLAKISRLERLEITFLNFINNNQTRYEKMNLTKKMFLIGLSILASSAMFSPSAHAESGNGCGPMDGECCLPGTPPDDNRCGGHWMDTGNSCSCMPNSPKIIGGQTSAQAATAIAKSKSIAAGKTSAFKVAKTALNTSMSLLSADQLKPGIAKNKIQADQAAVDAKQKALNSLGLKLPN